MDKKPCVKVELGDMEIRDTRNGDWHWVYNALLADPHLFPNDKLVYAAISTFGGHQVIHPTIEQISERCGVSERGVQLSLNKLEEVGYIEMEKSTGRGNANVYYLLKKSKGCNHCALSKGCNEQQERVQPSAIKGAMTAPHIDIYKDKKDIRNSGELQEVTIEERDTEKKQSTAKYPNAFEVFDLWGNYPRAWKSTKNARQREAAQNLYEERGLEKISEALQFLKDFGDREFCPEVHSPYDLDSKWAKLEAFSNKLSKIL